MWRRARFWLIPAEEEAFKRGAVRTAGGKPWTDAENRLLLEMAEGGLNPQQIYDSGRFPERTVEAINKQLERCRFVATRQKTFVETIEPSESALSMEDVVKLFSRAFEQICGLTEVDKLVRETLSLAGTPYVEMPAVMAKYNPFAEKAGMRKIAEQTPPKEALKIAEILQKLGFNIQLLGSEKYVLNKLQTLSDEGLEKLREAFIKHCHARFMKYFFCYIPFGRKEVYAKEVMKASLERLARLIKVCGFLMQTKAYLSWGKGM